MAKRKRKLTPLQAIKEHCRICQGLEEGQHLEDVKACKGDWSVREDGCPIWPFRMGRNPNYSEETRQKRAARMKETRANGLL